MSSPTALQTENALDEIAKLETLRDQGVITEVEFQEQRKELIATLTVNKASRVDHIICNCPMVGCS